MGWDKKPLYDHEGLPNLNIDNVRQISYTKRIPFIEAQNKINQTVKKELEWVGILCKHWSFILDPDEYTQKDIDRREVPAKYLGYLRGWTFERCWYYWRAIKKDFGIQLDKIKTLAKDTYNTGVVPQDHCKDETCRVHIFDLNSLYKFACII